MNPFGGEFLYREESFVSERLAEGRLCIEFQNNRGSAPTHKGGALYFREDSLFAPKEALPQTDSPLKAKRKEFFEKSIQSKDKPALSTKKYVEGKTNYEEGKIFFREGKKIFRERNARDEEGKNFFGQSISDFALRISQKRLRKTDGKIL